MRFWGKYCLSVLWRAQGDLWMNFHGQELAFSVPCMLRVVKVSESWSKPRAQLLSVHAGMLTPRKSDWVSTSLQHIYPGPNCLSGFSTHYIIFIYQMFIISHWIVPDAQSLVPAVFRRCLGWPPPMGFPPGAGKKTHPGPGTLPLCFSENCSET